MLSTKWRVYCYAGGFSNIALAEIKMYETSGGTNACSGGTVNASYNNGSYPKENAFDGNASTFWWTDTNSNQWIEYEFATAKEIVELKLTARNDGYYTDSPTNFALQYYDGSSYVTALSRPSETGWTNGQERTYTLYELAGTITESLAITDWRITANDSITGEVWATDSVTGSTYRLLVDTSDPCNITLASRFDYVWSANKVAALNELVLAASPDATPHIWEVTTAGTFGGTEPTWNLSGTTTSGTATLTYVGALIDPVTLGPKIPSVP